ncbi:MAG: hypothetical protein JO100_09000 [Pseudonocardia sp.]|nr:hypothetical protein [Pseudonocardia sp.]
MNTIIVTELIIVVVVVLAAVGGWATSGTTRLGRLVGFLLGLPVGLALVHALVPPADDRTAHLAVILIGMVSGGLLGSAILGGLGHWVARGLYRLRLGSLDRLLGALLSGVLALVVCGLVLGVLSTLGFHTGMDGLPVPLGHHRT